MLSINENTIYLTRGDSASIKLTLLNSDGTSYSPDSGDTIRFAMKQYMSDSAAVLVTKSIDTSTLILSLAPSDTESLTYSTSRPYKYDIEITYSGGDVDTFIADANIYILPEVDVHAS